jgi:WhiB family redox-sensing transcriptional regulator
MNWRDRASCLDADTEAFFVNLEWPLHPAAETYCHACPVRDECLTDAYETDDRWAVRGGLTPAQRETGRRRAKRVAAQRKEA